MLTASRSLRKAAAAEPLPGVPALWRLTHDGVCLRRGELVMLVGVPNSGKSAFALWWAASLNLMTLYFSADNNAHTSLTRLLSFVTQTERRSIENDLDDHDTGDVMEDYYSDALKGSNLQFVFDGSLTLKAVTAELNAYVEIYDEWPEVIVVDNLINVEGTGDHEGQSGILSELHYLARQTGATVFVLHHASESNQQKPTKAPPRAAIQNKVSHFPDLVLSVAVDSLTGDFEVAAIKVRGDRSDPSALRPYLLYADLAKCSFLADNPQSNWSPSGWCNDDE
jgi:replicative DNA helicase